MGTAATSHIIKPGIAGLDSQALVEHISLRALGHLGLNVARSAFAYFENEPAIVVERFDRYRDDAGRLRRVHQEDLCQSTSTLPAKKYTVKAEKVVETLRGGGASEEIVLEFVRAVIANGVLAAPDGHAKNHSVFLDSSGVAALSQLYDVATGVGHPQYSTLAMGFDGEKEIHKVSGRHLLRFAQAVGVDGEQVVEASRAMAGMMPLAFAAAVAETRIDAEITVESQRWLNTLTEELREHCGHVLNRLERTR